MPRGSKAAYNDKQKRQAEHIEEGYEKRRTSAREAAKRAWAIVNMEVQAEPIAIRTIKNHGKHS